MTFIEPFPVDCWMITLISAAILRRKRGVAGMEAAELSSDSFDPYPVDGVMSISQTDETAAPVRIAPLKFVCRITGLRAAEPMASRGVAEARLGRLSHCSTLQEA